MFWKKSPEKKLQKQYEDLQKEAFRLSTIDRKQADAKYAEAEEIMNKLVKLREQS